jgi:isopenicillin N synthase-like dioxygenase
VRGALAGTDLRKHNQSKQIFAGYHYDLNFLTIHGKARFPGLFVWLRNGHRIPVKMPEGCLLLQVRLARATVIDSPCPPHREAIPSKITSRDQSSGGMLGSASVLTCPAGCSEARHGRAIGHHQLPPDNPPSLTRKTHALRTVGAAQAGKQFEWLTGGHVRAGMHEVIFSGACAAAVEAADQRDPAAALWRVSSTLFGHVASDVVLQPLGRFQQAPHAAAYPSTVCGDYVQAELEAISLKGRHASA